MDSVLDVLDVTNYTRIAEPINVTEIEGGKYDGHFRVEAECPGCGNTTVHLMAYDNYGPCHRVADCGNMCPGGYNMVRPLEGLLGGALKWWKDTHTGLGFSPDGHDGPGLLNVEVA